MIKKQKVTLEIEYDSDVVDDPMNWMWTDMVGETVEVVDYEQPVEVP